MELGGGVITDYWVVLYPVLGAGRIQNRESSRFPSGGRIWQLHLCGQCLMWAAQRSVYGGGGHGKEQFPWPCAKSGSSSSVGGNTEVADLRGEERHCCPGDGESGVSVLSFFYCWWWRI